MTPDSNRRQLDPVTLERHVQTILIAVITGVIMFAGSYFFSDNRSKGELEQRIVFLSSQVAELRKDVRDFQAVYQRREGDWVTQAQFTAVNADQESRLRALERAAFSSARR